MPPRIRNMAPSASTPPAWTGPSRRAKASTATPTAIGIAPPRSPPTRPITACSPCSTICRAAAPARSSNRRRAGPAADGRFLYGFMDVAAASTPASPLSRSARSRRCDRAGWAAELGRLAHYGIRGAVGAESRRRTPSRRRDHPSGAGGLEPADGKYYLSAEPAGLQAHRLSDLSRPVADPRRRGQCQARAATVVQFERNLAESAMDLGPRIAVGRCSRWGLRFREARAGFDGVPSSRPPAPAAEAIHAGRSRAFHRDV